MEAGLRIPRTFIDNPPKHFANVTLEHNEKSGAGGFSPVVVSQNNLYQKTMQRIRVRWIMKETPNSKIKEFLDPKLQSERFIIHNTISRETEGRPSS
jgi:hypothetical protein